jgi:hypothetical protein
VDTNSEKLYDRSILFLIFYLAESKELWNLVFTLCFLVCTTHTGTNRAGSPTKRHGNGEWVFRPAMKDVVQRDIFAAYPPSSAEAKNKANANSKEQIRPRVRTPAPPRQMMLSNIVPSRYLAQVWERVQAHIHTLDDGSRLRNPRLLISGKNLKNLTKDHNVETSTAQSAWNRSQLSDGGLAGFLASCCQKWSVLGQFIYYNVCSKHLLHFFENKSKPLVRK